MTDPASLQAIESRVVRRLQWRILPFVMLLYFVSFLDRVNVGFATLSMNKAIGLTPAMFGLGGGIFFLGYFLFEVPSNLILYRVGAPRWIARVMVTWGLVSAASAFAVGSRSFYVLRFLLGVAEAGFFPGIILYLNLWFPARHRAVAAGLFMAAAPLSTALGSPVSGALMALPRSAGLSNWQWLYLCEALPAILLGFVVMRVLTARPEEAHWLAADERAWLVTTLHGEAGEGGRRSSHTGSVWRVMADPRVLALSLIYMGTSAGLYTLGLWSPLILRQFGLSALQTGWVNAIPSVAAVMAMIAWARHSDRSMERTWHVVLPCLCGCVGFLWAGATHTLAGVVLALVAANIGISAAKAPLWAMPATFLSGASAAAGFAVINSVGNLGGFIGPYLIGWVKSRTGSYAGGLYVVSLMLLASASFTLLLGRQPHAPRALPTP